MPLILKEDYDAIYNVLFCRTRLRPLTKFSKMTPPPPPGGLQMAKKFKRGKPDGSADLERQKVCRDLTTTYSAELRNEFGDYKLYNLVNGEIELVSERGEEFRLYYVVEGVGRGSERLIIDDYHPEEDAEGELPNV